VTSDGVTAWRYAELRVELSTIDCGWADDAPQNRRLEHYPSKSIHIRTSLVAAATWRHSRGRYRLQQISESNPGQAGHHAATGPLPVANKRACSMFTNCPTHLRGICCVTTSIWNGGGNKYLNFLVHLPLVIPMLNLRNSRPIFTKFGASVTQLDAMSTSQTKLGHAAFARISHEINKIWRPWEILN
jgi:hypothetical protein